MGKPVFLTQQRANPGGSGTFAMGAARSMRAPQLVGLPTVRRLELKAECYGRARMQR